MEDREDRVVIADDGDVVALPPKLPPKPGIIPPSEVLEDWMARVEASPEPEWLLDGILEPKGLLLTVGPEKEGKKSWLMGAMVLSAASGKPVGIFEPTRPLRVLYFNQEGADRNTMFRMRGLMRGAGITHADLGGRLHWAQGGAIHPLDLPQRKALIARVRNEQFDIVLMDTFAKSYGRDENDSREMGAFLAAIYDIQMAGAAVVLVAHTNKASREDSAAFDFTRGIRGSSALSAGFDVGLASLILDSKVSPNRMLLKRIGKNVEPVHYLADWHFSGRTDAPDFSVHLTVDGGPIAGLYPESVDEDEEGLDLNKKGWGR